jgi:hypothetical protein
MRARREGCSCFSDEWFDEEKARIFERCEPVLSRMRLILDHVLVAIWVRPEWSVGGLIQIEAVRKEDIYQGVTGLVLKIGPRCFEDSPVLTWTAEDRFKVGDWVMFRKADCGGYPLTLNGSEAVPCLHFAGQRGIRMVLPRPDVVLDVVL